MEIFYFEINLYKNDKKVYSDFGFEKGYYASTPRMAVFYAMKFMEKTNKKIEFDTVRVAKKE